LFVTIKKNINKNLIKKKSPIKHSYDKNNWAIHQVIHSNCYIQNKFKFHITSYENNIKKNLFLFFVVLNLNNGILTTQVLNDS